jgi:putative nucleotidyltransferase with HDIG domain
LLSQATDLVRQEGVAASLVILLAFFLLTGSLMLIREEVLPYRPGQHVAQDLVSRVDFNYMDKDKLVRARQEARDRVIRVYKPHEKAWEHLQGKLLELPDRVAARTVDETPHSVRALFHVEAGDVHLDLTQEGLTALVAARDEQNRKGYEEAVRAYVDSLRWMTLVPEQQRREEIRRQEEILRATPRIEVAGVGMVDVSRTMAAAPTPYLVDELRQAAERKLPTGLRDSLAAFTANEIEPTIELDEAATTQRQNDAASRVPTSAGLVAYKANQVLKHHEKPVTETEWAVMKAEQEAFLNALPVSTWFRSKIGSVAVVLVVTLSLAAYVARYQPRVVRRRERGIALAALLIAGLLVAQLATLADWPLYLFGTAPTLFVAMVLCVAYDRRFAMGIATLHAVLVTFALDQDVSFFLILFVGSATLSFFLKEVRTRNTLIEMGALAGAAMMVTAAAAMFTSLDPIQPAAFVWRNCVYVGVGAVGAGFVMQGLLRPMEQLFRMTTGMTLLELADASRPLLKRLAVEAPGTYSHSMHVATLAEAGAEAIGADALLCRVGAYYHDVGKVNKPEYFVENQFDGVNRHVKLSPSVSLLVIIGHVKDGVALAKEARLPASLISFIQQHHGTTLVEYFYHQACQKKDGATTVAVSEMQYRYPGPKPRTREVAIVMLADAVESATRAMKDWSAARIESLVHDLAMKRLLDGQFDECDLTIRELDRIERAMVKTLLGIYHGRIAYPPAAATAKSA